MYKTTNTGATWVQQTTGITNPLYGLYFSNVDTGTVVGDSGTILHTTNGGTTWEPQKSNTDITLNSVTFVNVDTGFVAGSEEYQDFYGMGTRNVLLRTTNGGAVWEPLVPGSEWLLHGVYFINADTGFTVSGGGSDVPEGAVSRTTDGGIGWINWDTALEEFSGITFTSPTNGYVVGGNIYHTTDGGLTWNGQSGIGHSISFSDSLHGTVVDDYGAIMRTTNGGTTWGLQPSGTSNALLAVCAINSHSETAVGWWGTILHTNDNGGLNLPNITLTYSGQHAIHSVCNPKDTSFVQIASEALQPLIVKSASFDSPYYTLASAVFPDTLACDSQRTYTVIFSPPTTGNYTSILNIYNNDPLHNPLQVYWQSRKDSIAYTLYSITGTMLGDTLDIGVVPDSATKDTSFILLNVSTEETTFYPGVHDDIFVSIGPLKLFVGASDTVHVRFLGEDVPGTYYDSLSIYDSCGLLGNLYLIVKTQPTAIEEPALNQFDLSITRNYPNPFSVATTITYSLPAAMPVSLGVYNALGERVAMLVNAKQSAGEHSTSFNARGFPEGVYFYRLAAGRDMRTGTMMVVR